MSMQWRGRVAVQSTRCSSQVSEKGCRSHARLCGRAGVGLQTWTRCRMKFGEEYIATSAKWTPSPRTSSAWLRANASRNERVGHFRLRVALGEASCSDCLQPRPRSTQAAGGRLILPDPSPGKTERTESQRGDFE